MPAKKSNSNGSKKESVSFKSLGLGEGQRAELNWSKCDEWFEGGEGSDDVFSMEFIITGGWFFHDKTNDVDKVVLEIREPGNTVKYHVSLPDNEERQELLEVVKLVCKKQKKEITNVCFQRIPTKFRPYIRVISTDDAVNAMHEAEDKEIPF